MRVLGIDPGFGLMGYGVIESSREGCRALSYGCVKTSSKLPFSERLERLYDAVTELIARSRPSRIVIEKLFFEKNTKTAIDVAQARGIILLAVIRAQVPFIECTPLQVKLAVAGYGKADKRQVQQMVRQLLKFPVLPKQDDAADALAIAYCGATINTNPKS